MFYNETMTMELVGEDPSLVFELIKKGHLEFVDMLLKEKDTALIIGLLLILMSENTDKILLFALIYILI